MSDQREIRSAWLTGISKCKCSKSDVKMNKQSCTYFEDVATRIKDRRCDLMGRHKFLRDKITTMERSVPALMAYNMWMAGQNCPDSPYCKIREIMKKFSPCPDPTDRLLEKLNYTVKELSEETTALHDKIINADVELEETDMELESIELANKEMAEELNELERQVLRHRTPSLRSVHSDDLICLRRIHQLAKEELCLKNCIVELEEKETLFRDQIDRLLSSKEFQFTSGTKKMVERIRELESNEKRMHCVLQSRKHDVHHLRRKLAQREKELARIDATASGQGKFKAYEVSDVKVAQDIPQPQKEINGLKAGELDAGECICTPLSAPKLVTCYEKARKFAANKSSRHSRQLRLSQLPCKTCVHSRVQFPKSKLCPPPFCCISLPTPRNKACKPCPPPPCSTPIRMKTPCSTSPLCERPPCIDSDIDHEPLKGDTCRCNCRGKCARGLSEVPCDCGVSSKCPLDKGYQPVASKLPREKSDDSDDEFCECCSCGCEDSTASLLCQ